MNQWGFTITEFEIVNECISATNKQHLKDEDNITWMRKQKKKSKDVVEQMSTILGLRNSSHDGNIVQMLGWTTVTCLLLRINLLSAGTKTMNKIEIFLKNMRHMKISFM